MDSEPSDDVLYDKRDRVAVITLNRPHRRNAVDQAMDQRLRDIWSDFRDDEGVDVAIWTGTGTSFCSGADRDTWFTQWLTAEPSDVRRNASSIGFGGLTRGLHHISKPVIGAINGWALGGGLELALACDIRIASDRAIFGTPLVGMGFHHGDGGISRLVNTCGTGVALDLELSGQPIDAHRALQCNLVTRVVAHDDLMRAAEALARHIVEHDQTAVHSAKQTVHDVVGRRLDDQLEREALSAYSAAGGERTGRVAETISYRRS
jgi:enoyl-CoA hydratase/carnithine racemase